MKARPPVDLTGQVYGRLTTIAAAPRSEKGEKCWLCRFTCGTEKAIPQWKLLGNKAKSCGCLARERQAAWGQAQKLKFAQARQQQERSEQQPEYQQQHQSGTGRLRLFGPKN